MDELAKKDCNRLCDRAVTIRLTAMCHLTGFMVAEDHHSQRRHAALRGTGLMAGGPAA